MSFVLIILVVVGVVLLWKYKRREKEEKPKRKIIEDTFENNNAQVNNTILKVVNDVPNNAISQLCNSRDTEMLFLLAELCFYGIHPYFDRDFVLAKRAYETFLRLQPKKIFSVILARQRLVEIETEWRFVPVPTKGRELVSEIKSALLRWDNVRTPVPVFQPPQPPVQQRPQQGVQQQRAQRYMRQRAEMRQRAGPVGEVFDKQNVHNSILLDFAKNSIDKIQSTPGLKFTPEQAEQAYYEMAIQYKNTVGNKRDIQGKVKDSDLNSVGLYIPKMDAIPHSKLNQSERGVFALVISRIYEPKHEQNRMNLLESLTKEIQKGRNNALCLTGRIARMLGVLDGVDEQVQLKPDWALRKELEGMIPRRRDEIVLTWSNDEQTLWNNPSVTDPGEIQQVQALRVKLKRKLEQIVQTEYGHVATKVLKQISSGLIDIAVE